MKREPLKIGERVRLRRRERSEKRERVEAFSFETTDGFAKILVWRKEDAMPGASLTRLVELRAGEAVVSRADLARAWDSKVAEAGDPIYPAKSGVSLTFDAFAKALGLEESK